MQKYWRSGRIYDVGSFWLSIFSARTDRLKDGPIRHGWSGWPAWLVRRSLGGPRQPEFAGVEQTVVSPPLDSMCGSHGRSRAMSVRYARVG